MHDIYSSFLGLAKNSSSYFTEMNHYNYDSSVHDHGMAQPLTVFESTAKGMWIRQAF